MERFKQVRIENIMTFKLYCTFLKRCCRGKKNFVGYKIIKTHPLAQIHLIYIVEKVLLTPTPPERMNTSSSFVVTFSLLKVYI